MKIKILNIFLFMLLPSLAWSQSLDQILEEHFIAIGQNNLIAMRSVALEVRLMDGLSNGRKFRIIKKFPNKLRIEGDWNGTPYAKCFDGQVAWEIAPWTGDSSVQILNERDKDLLLMDVGIGSPLYDYGLGNALELIGSERADDSNHYVIRSTSASGFVVDYLVDKIDKKIHLARIYSEEDPQKKEKEIIYKNYKDLPGVSIPFGYEHRTEQAISDLVTDDIVIGQGAPNQLFSAPKD